MKDESKPDGAVELGEIPDAISRNIKAVSGFYEAEERRISGPHDFIEKSSSFASRPGYLAVLVVLIVSWIVANLFAGRGGGVPFDPPPFLWLQGIIGLYALLISTAVLIRQQRGATLAEQRAHLDLQVNLLTESKVAKLIELVEELRRDLPNVVNRHDPDVESMQVATSPHAVLSALETHGADKKPAQ